MRRKVTIPSFQSFSHRIDVRYHPRAVTIHADSKFGPDRTAAHHSFPLCHRSHLRQRNGANSLQEHTSLNSTICTRTAKYLEVPRSTSNNTMELANIITGQLPTKGQSHFDDGAPQPQPQRTHSYPTRNTMTSSMGGRNTDERTRTPPATYYNNQSNSATPHSTSMSPFQSPTPKSIAFELLFQESPEYRARLPMRVNIFPHDTTDSIITTVKNFYGLYSGPNGSQGVSFEDEQSNTLIARYENLRNDMIVYVRVIEERAPDAYGPSSYHSDSPVISQAYYQGDGHQMPPPPEAQALNYGQPMSRPASRSSLKRSISPNHGRGRRSQSAVSNASIPAPMKKSQSRSGFKSRGSSTHGSFADINNDMMNGYSSGDGAAGSVSSKTKSEHLGNTEISLDNIVEGGRRKRAKFESSVSLRTIYKGL